VETQLLRIGQVMIAAVPGEFTTMAGRRLREALDSEAVKNGGPSNTKTVIAGLSNVYSHYITTFEEYQVYPRLDSIKLNVRQ
jgi:neutral ceramidase